MDLKKKIKGFFTLTRKANSGFTLVELIVVIAILAILGGVAVPAYSGYVTKANKSADEQLISDIEHALTLAGYNGTFTEGEGGYIVLSAETPYTSDDAGETSLDKALKATFGEGYSLQLKHDRWGNNGLAVGLTAGQAQAVYNSTYYAKSDELMGQVKQITDAAYALLENASGTANKEQMIAMFSDGTLKFEEAVQAYGYESIDDVPDEALPNLMVLAIAADITNEQNNKDDHEMSKAAGLIQDFALFNGYASTDAGKLAGANGTSFADAYDTFVEEISAANNDISEVANAYRKLKLAADNDTNYSVYISGDQDETDLQAFTAMMGGVAGAAMMNKDEITSELGNGDFFTAGLGKSFFDTYIGAVESAIGLDDAAGTAMAEKLFGDECEGNVGIFYSFVQNEVKIGDSLPVK